MTTLARLLTCTILLSLTLPSYATAQAVEVVGSRALGMGGAFVAVANDSSATWWNPAGPAAGPFVDVALARTMTAREEMLPAVRTPVSSFALTTPPFGISYYRLRITEIRGSDSTADTPPDRQDGGAGVGLRSLSMSQFGVTLLQTLISGVHVGTTLKYLRGTARLAAVAETGTDVGDLLDQGEALDGGDTEHGFDLDAGVLAVAGPVRIGALVRNVTEPEFGGMRLPRQARIGVAYDGEAIGAAPWVVSVDADLRRYDAGAGDRRVVAAGVERWLAGRRVGLRGGGRINTVGARDEALTAGVSIAPRAAFYLDAHVVGGGDTADTGWGVAARVSF